MQEDKNKRAGSKSEGGVMPDKDTVAKAMHEAEKDIAADPDLNNISGPETDLDEGELAKLESED